MDTAIPDHNLLLPLTRFIGIVAPSLYCGNTAQYSAYRNRLTLLAEPGFTASDSLTFVQPILSHAPNQKVMAKQWLHGYQYGPYWVPPLIAPATLANLYLALGSQDLVKRGMYVVAAMGIFSILPITFFYMEPGINGACKWKVQSLLKEEGFSMPETSVFVPSSVKHGSTAASRRWADGSEMGELIQFWRRVNNLRWIIAGFAAVCSGMATLGP